MMPKTGGKRGRPLHPKTAHSSWIVEFLTSRGIRQSEIARVVGISERGLRYRYRPEIELGQARITMTATQKLMQKIEAGDDAAIIFWLETKGGFSPIEGKPTADTAIH